MSRKHTLAIGCLLLAALAAAYAFVSGFSAREDRKREQAAKPACSPRRCRQAMPRRFGEAALETDRFDSPGA